MTPTCRERVQRSLHKRRQQGDPQKKQGAHREQSVRLSPLPAARWGASETQTCPPCLTGLCGHIAALGTDPILVWGALFSLAACFMPTWIWSWGQTSDQVLTLAHLLLSALLPTPTPTHTLTHQPRSLLHTHTHRLTHIKTH